MKSRFKILCSIFCMLVMVFQSGCQLAAENTKYIEDKWVGVFLTYDRPIEDIVYATDKIVDGRRVEYQFDGVKGIQLFVHGELDYDGVYCEGIAQSENVSKVIDSFIDRIRDTLEGDIYIEPDTLLYPNWVYQDEKENIYIAPSHEMGEYYGSNEGSITYTFPDNMNRLLNTWKANIKINGKDES